MATTISVRRWIHLFALTAAVLLTGGCGGRSAGELTRYSEQKEMMGTVVQVDVCMEEGLTGEQRDAAYTAMWSRLEDIAWRMNVYDPQSDVTKLNTTFPEAVSVGADTYDMLRRSVNYAQQTQGTFMISVWPLIKLWRASQDRQQPPPRDELRQILRQIGMDQLTFLPGNRVARRNPVISVDLGGIAKGYAVDEAARIFREHGLRRFYIDAGGDIYVGGRNCRGDKWRIGIKDPRDRTRIVETVAVTDAAVTTSGNYEQFLMIQGERYSHIIDPSSGYPQKEVVSASVIAPTAEQADVFSTALTVLGKKRGTELIDSGHPDMASLILVRQPDGNVVRTESRRLAEYLIP